ncbi:GntR family transcriptional regulator [Paracoccus sp. (in: a-proteobacteria)]|uniref:GntR family transcriptional regulator n=1 Tax=Paracoccus sp. TaxID=267 RepID=UPI003A842AB8
MARQSYRLQIYNDYRARIQRGEIGPDDRLVDTIIAAELGVSRMPVRDALMQLTHEGYLEGTTRGFALPSLSSRQVMDIFELRRLLEPRAVALATRGLTDDDIATLGRAVSEARSTVETNDLGLFFKASETFRNTWLGAVPNAELRQTIQRYLAQVQTVRVATMRDPETRDVIVAGQQDLYRTFQRRDTLAAHDRMLRFVMQAEASYAETLRQEPESAA